MAASMNFMRNVNFVKSSLSFRFLGIPACFSRNVLIVSKDWRCSWINRNTDWTGQGRSIRVDRPLLVFNKGEEGSASLSSSSSSSSDEQSSDSETDIELRARPRDRKQERQKFNMVNKSQNVDTKPFAEKVLNAAEAVAKLSDDPDKTVGDLLSRLQMHSIKESEPGTSEQSSLGDLLSTMKTEKFTSESKYSLNKDKSDVMKMEASLFDGKSVGDMLYTGERLNIFSFNIMRQQPQESPTPLMDKLRMEEMEMLANIPPSNAFQEMIKWTKKGKMWHFPIDNEQGLDEERNIPFTEHVFLNHLIEDFPKKGPIRHFMELVVVGLSKNPYLTVQEKHHQIQWFRDYFKDKMHLVEFVDSKQDKIDEI